MTVLDLGSGAGDVALLLADLVGPQGRVVGIDMNPAILETARARAQAAGWTRVDFRAGDIKTADVGANFDAVVGRWILMAGLVVLRTYGRCPDKTSRGQSGHLLVGGRRGGDTAVTR